MTKHTPTMEIITDGELACLNVDGKLFSAPYVVAAINSHEEILQALKVAMKALQYWGDKAETYEKANDPVRLNAHGIVNEAIAKAEGK